MRALARRRLRRPARRGALHRRAQRRRQVDADQVHRRRRRADRGRDPHRRRAARRRARRRRSAAASRTIYQELDLVGDLTVADNIFLGHERRRWGLLDRPRMRRETTELLARVNHEGISPATFVRDLRPAGQQIVSIARSLSHDVRLLIMDEPSAILDDSEIETLFDVVRRLAAEGVGVVYISHRLDEIRRDRRSSHRAQRGRHGRLRAARDHAGRRARDADGRPQARAAVPRASAAPAATSCSRCAASRRLPDVKDRHRSTCTPARCSASPGSSAPAAASCCARSTASTAATPARCSSTACRCRRAGPTGRSPPGSAWPRRTASRRRCCSSGA